MKLNEYLLEIEKFLKNKLDETHTQGYVLGVSGGIDSALVALLAHRAVGDKLFCLILPCESHPDDAKDAIELLEKFKIKYEIIDLTSTYHTIISDMEKNVGPLSNLAKNNTKVRLRMVTLYAIGQTKNSLVLGTDNWDESYTGYFTKYGDGACDLLPIVKLTKKEVFDASKLMGVTTNILNRKPSAGLFLNQTDEDELGVTYDELDSYLLGKEIRDDAKKSIEQLHKNSNHKREPIPCPNEFIRD